MQIATKSVEFSFNDVMYRQIDGVAMGSPLGPTLANIFVLYHETRFFSIVPKPDTYFRYVDDIFASFPTEDDCDKFFRPLIGLYPSLTFTAKSRNSLTFLDVLVEKVNDEFITSVYRKDTFTGQYIP